MTTRAEIVAEAMEWISTPWHHQASRKGVGTDCRGIVVGVARAFNMPEAAAFDRCRDFNNYGREPDFATGLAACMRFLDPVEGEPQPGDVLYLRVPRVAHPMHFAIVGFDDCMIHAALSPGRVVVHHIGPWRRRIVRVFSYRGIQ